MTWIVQRYRRAILWIRAHGVVLRNSGLAIVVFLAAFFFTQWWDFTVPSLGRAPYQAVFLANGQTYFGRYYERIGAYAKIEDVYYLQQSQGSDATQAPDTRLLRRGKELHAPHGRRDRITRARDWRAYIERAAEVARVAAFTDVGDRGHYLLTGMYAWNGFIEDRVRRVLL